MIIFASKSLIFSHGFSNLKCKIRLVGNVLHGRAAPRRVRVHSPASFCGVCHKLFRRWIELIVSLTFFTFGKYLFFLYYICFISLNAITINFIQVFFIVKRKLASSISLGSRACVFLGCVSFCDHVNCSSGLISLFFERF